MTAQTISAAWVNGIAEVFQDAGLNVAAIFTEAGLDIQELNNPDARFLSKKISVLWEIATIRANNPAIGLTKILKGNPANFGPISFLMMSSSNLLIGLGHLIRYLPIFSGAVHLALHQGMGGYSITLEVCEDGHPVPRQRIEHAFVSILYLCRWITGREINPLMVEFANPAPVSLSPYAEVFSCPLQFDAPIHRLLFSHCDLYAPLPTSNPDLAVLHEKYTIQHLKRLDDARICIKIRSLIAHRLSDGETLRGNIAKTLCMGERTLQRRLRKEGVSFKNLVDTTRRDMAEQYLGQSHLALTQIVAMLGFSDQSTFYRCCKRWFRMSPTEFRAHLFWIRGVHAATVQSTQQDGALAPDDGHVENGKRI